MDDLFSQCLCIDLETSRGDAHVVHRIAASRADTGAHAVLPGVGEARAIAGTLDELARGAAFLLGHNIARHDLPVLRTRYPELRLHELPVVDTLELSPLAFPQNPYHRLLKDYKLVRDSRNDPLQDAKLAYTLWRDEVQAFAALERSEPRELACHHFLLASSGSSGNDQWLCTIRGREAPGREEVHENIRALAAGKTCESAIDTVIASALADPALHMPLSYVLAWLRVSGGNSVLPRWVREQYAPARELIRRLRQTPCVSSGCTYCRTYHDPRSELERLFGFPSFRPEPQHPDGGSLQEHIVRLAYAGTPVMAILPTGGGKSICYQLPGLSSYWASGSLTVVISPLQSLMKDQVDNLVKQGIFSAAALNGLLTMPERRDVLDKIRLGDVGLLFVSPEQFRNKTFVDTINYREVSAWVFDEAHCLSRWGHDFRPDYLYVSRVIRERYRAARAPVHCYTATAKQEVVQDLKRHFSEALEARLTVLDGGHDRPNLHYEVLPVKRAEKLPLIHRLLEDELREGSGGAIVFAAYRKNAEHIAGFLTDMGWTCAHFHGGRDATIKKDVQQAFIDGSVRVIVATNAFGMGVDKPDVRLVIHAEIPGSLENYLQEAGRAGRDRSAARCVLLFDEDDVEGQFSLAARSRLSRHEVANILRLLRRYSRRTNSAELVLTAGEIMAQDDSEEALESERRDAETKVRTALAWLERARCLQRDENRTRVFPANLKVGSVAQADEALRKANFAEQTRARYLDLVSALLNAAEDEGISTDALTLQIGVAPEECISMLVQLEKLDLLSNDLGLTVLLRQGIPDSAADRLRKVSTVERALLELLPELAPEAGHDEWNEMSLRGVCQEVRNRTAEEVLPEQLLSLMRSLARPFGEGANARRAMFDIRVLRREVLRVRLLRSWTEIDVIARRRQAVASVLLKTLLGKLAAGVQGADLRVECRMGELTRALRLDTEIGPTIRPDDIATAIEAGLLYLHDNSVLLLDRGKTVFRPAMTIRVDPKKSFTVADYAPLKAHFDERTFQIHVMHEYARLGLRKVSEALGFVLAYFTMTKLAFVRRYFAHRRDMLERATTAESYERIVESLRHPIQQRLVCDRPETNRLILAGPGSGKTRVVVHRVAYLVRVVREPPESILVLAYNRSAAVELRLRLRALIGQDAAGVTVLTYHALALRLTGVSLAAAERAAGERIDFDGVLDKAIELLEPSASPPGDPAEVDELRERLLSGYRHILVDEYQDIDSRQYSLISGLAGRRLADPEARLTVLAVGDDDQNIYAFRHTSNEFIRRFREDYKAQVEYLVENYRSTRHIIVAANAIIARNRDRLKAEHPIRINEARALQPPGGRWETVDAFGNGRVRVLGVPREAAAQAQIVMAELANLKRLDSGIDWSQMAILARKRATLDPIRAWCEVHGVPYGAPDLDASSQPRLHQTREGRRLRILLETKSAARMRPAVISRWMRCAFGGEVSDNPWVALLREFSTELDAGWGDLRIPRSLALDFLVEFGAEARRAPAGKLVLTTVHGAKGREFDHVVILDSGDWQPGDEERRLYYVGMTRAKETLTLCESVERPNPFSRTLEPGPEVLRVPAPQGLEIDPRLLRRYVTLGLPDVDLDFAGRCRPAHLVHARLSELRYGDELTAWLEEGRLVFHTRDGVPVGRTSRSFGVPSGSIVRATVSSLVHRAQSSVRGDPSFLSQIKAREWWVVLPTIVLE
jgi:ATP-dependent DNA helicase RecQ